MELFSMTFDEMSPISEPPIEIPLFAAATAVDKSPTSSVSQLGVPTSDSDGTTCGTGTNTPSDFSDSEMYIPFLPFYFSCEPSRRTFCDSFNPIGGCIPSPPSAVSPAPEDMAACHGYPNGLYSANPPFAEMSYGGTPCSSDRMYEFSTPTDMRTDPYMDPSTLLTLQDLLNRILSPPPPPLQISNSAEPRSIFIGNIPPGVSLFVLQKSLSAYGPLNFCFFSSLRLELEDLPTSTEDSWNCAFATFFHSSSAKVCIQAINNKRVFPGHAHHKIVCCVAPMTPKSIAALSMINCQSLRLSFQPLYDEIVGELGNNKPHAGFSLLRDGPAGSNLFVYGLPSDWTEVPLLEICQEFGHVVGVRVPMSDNDGRTTSHERSNRGFGFVSYDCCESAFKALSKLATSTLLSKQLKVQLKSGEGHLCPHELSHFVQKSRRSTGAVASNLWSNTDQPIHRKYAGRDRQATSTPESAKSKYSGGRQR